MSSFVKWFLIACILLVLLYKYATRKFKYWKKLGVKQLNPVPILGDGFWGAVRIHNPLDDCLYYYESFKKHRFGGIYMNTEPFLSITDPELIKLILVKDAEYFVNRHDWSFGTDPLLSNNLISLKDEKWRKMRQVFTTVFTSAKMKDMFGFMDTCAKQSVKYLETKVLDEFDQTGQEVYELECRDFFSRFGTDVIGSTAFGLDVDSFKNPDNEFYNSGTAIRNLFTGWHMVKILLMSMSPYLSKKFGFSILGEKYTKFFTSLIEETIRVREEKNIVRKDVVHILMEARKGITENGDLVKGKLPDLTDLDIAAQALFFFFGGFDTMATLLGFISYELAVNPDVQEILQREIDEVVEKNGITYEGVLHDMQYLDMVVKETLRKWPPAVMTDRSVSKTYTIPKTDVSPEVVLNRDAGIWISIAALHYDPEYFPDPHKFDPERFRDEKNTIKPFTYLPFGDGIRHCIAMRYALMETKIIIVHMLRKFTFVPSKNTLIPMKLSKKRPLTLEPENGFWLGIKPRN